MPIAQIAHYDHSQTGQWHYAVISQPEATLTAAVVSTIVIVIGWVVVQRYNLIRERENRAHNLRVERKKRSNKSHSADN